MPGFILPCAGTGASAALVLPQQEELSRGDLSFGLPRGFLAVRRWQRWPQGRHPPAAGSGVRAPGPWAASTRLVLAGARPTWHGYRQRAGFSGVGRRRPCFGDESRSSSFFPGRAVSGGEAVGLCGAPVSASRKARGWAGVLGVRPHCMTLGWPSIYRVSGVMCTPSSAIQPLRGPYSYRSPSNTNRSLWGPAAGCPRPSTAHPLRGPWSYRSPSSNAHPLWGA